MSRKIKLFIAASLDGYIAAEDESLQWLFDVEGEGDNGYAEFYHTIETVLMGRKTYDWLIRQDLEEFPYENKECYVFTRILDKNSEHVIFTNEDVTDFISRLKEKDGKDIWVVGGGGLLHSFLKENLVDELILTVAPTLLGKGVPLFKEKGIQIDLTLKNVRKFNQFVELHYEVKK